MKAPMNNKGRSALFSKPSFNIYFGVNVGSAGDDTFMRTAYGVGSGSSSIGIDPRTVRCYPIFHKLSKLMYLANSLVQQDTTHRMSMGGSSFNFCNVKIYYAFKNREGTIVKKTTEYHTDVTYNKTGEPDKNNSQKPGTPVAICTFGDSKNLWFRRYSHVGNKEAQVNSLVRFLQKSGSLIVLDGRDEAIKNGLCWKHMSDMAEEKDMTVSYMSRVVQTERLVHAHRHTMVVQKELSKWKKGCYEKALKDVSTERYVEEKQKVQDGIRSLVKKY